MPNWCENRVTVTGDETDLVAFRNLVEGLDNHGYDSVLSFHQILPMPDILVNTRSPIKVVDTVAEAITQNSDMNKTFKGFGDGEGNRVGAMTKNASDDLLKKYGANNRYDWSNEIWGTKWQPSDITAEYESDVITYDFDTAWSPPSGIYLALVQQFPNVHISWFYNEPGMQVCGYLDKEYAL